MQVTLLQFCYILHIDYVWFQLLYDVFKDEDIADRKPTGLRTTSLKWFASAPWILA